MSRRCLYQSLKEQGVPISFSNVSQHILRHLKLREAPEESSLAFRNAVSRFCSDLSARWGSAFRMEDRFFDKNRCWLDSPFKVPSEMKAEKQKNGGRPVKDFQDCSDRAKKMRTGDLIDRPPQELAYATSRAFKSAGRSSTASLLQAVATASPEAVREIQKKIDHEEVKEISADRTLALIVDGKLGRETYFKVKRCTMESGAKQVYPSYHKVQAAKMLCYPPKEDITVTDVGAKIKLQGLLDHAAKRLFSVLQNVFEALPTETNFQTVYKYGMDGSSDHSQFKKKSEAGFSDSNMFLITVVQLQISCKRQTESAQKDFVVWKNERPCSTRLARPIKFTFEKETLELVKRERDEIHEQIESLVPTVIEGRTFSHVLHLTMIDGKVCHFLTRHLTKCATCVASSRPK